MTVRLGEDGAIRLEGACPIEDAEDLLRLRILYPDAAIDWRACDQAHTAMVQLLSVGQPTLVGPPTGNFLREMIAPLLDDKFG